MGRIVVGGPVAYAIVGYWAVFWGRARLLMRSWVTGGLLGEARPLTRSRLIEGIFGGGPVAYAIVSYCFSSLLRSASHWSVLCGSASRHISSI